jgi:hypothetical protein
MKRGNETAQARARVNHTGKHVSWYQLRTRKVYDRVERKKKLKRKSGACLFRRVLLERTRLALTLPSRPLLLLSGATTTNITSSTAMRLSLHPTDVYVPIIALFCSPCVYGKAPFVCLVGLFVRFLSFVFRAVASRVEEVKLMKMRSKARCRASTLRVVRTFTSHTCSHSFFSRTHDDNEKELVKGKANQRSHRRVKITRSENNEGCYLTSPLRLRLEMGTQTQTNKHTPHAVLPSDGRANMRT